MKIKNNFKKIIAGTLAGLIALASVPFSALAVENKTNIEPKNSITVSQTGNAMDYIKYNDGNSLIFPKNITNEGKPAYCIEQAKPNPPVGGVTYNKGGTLDNGINYILSNGLNEYGQGNRSLYLVGNDDYDFYITQAAIHIYNGQTSTQYMTHSTGDSRILDNAKSLANDAKNRANQKSLTVNISPSTQEFYLSGDNYVTEWFSLNASGDYTSYKVMIKNMPEGMEVVDYNGNVVTNSDIAPNTQFYLRIPVNMVTGDINISLGAIVFYQKFVSDAWIPNNTTYQQTTFLQENPTQDEGENYANATLKALGNLNIIKTSEDGNVANIPFKVTNETTGEINNVTTDANGNITIPNLIQGWYVVEELAPNEYVQPQSQRVEVKAGQTTTVNFNNVLKRGELKIIKTSEDGNVANIKFTVKSEKTGDIYKVKTDNKGQIHIPNLKVGWYVVEELAPNEYIQPQSQRVEIKSNETATVTFNNVLKRGNIDGYKKADNGFELAGAEIGLFAKDNLTTPIQTCMTNEIGYFLFENVVYGDYVVKEIKAPEGYILSDKEYPVNIRENNVTITIDDIINEIIKGKIEGIKIDSVSGKPLAGAEIGIYDELNNLVESVITDEQGYFCFLNVPFGKYIVKEIAPPKGWILTEETFEVEITENNQVIKLEIKNEPEVGKIIIEYKPDEPTENVGGNPMTGSAGVVGLLGIMGLAGATTLFTRKRKKEEN